MDAIIHCKTEEQAIELFKRLHEEGFTWHNGGPLCDNGEYHCYWGIHKRSTCYHIFDRMKDISYGGLCYYQKDGYDIVPFEVISNMEVI